MLNAREVLEEIIRLADDEIEHWGGLAKAKISSLKGRCFRDQCLAKQKEAMWFKLAANGLKKRAEEESW